MSKPSLKQFHEQIIACRRCSRLVNYLSSIKKDYPGYWCLPVPGWGDPKAKIMLLGLAPGRRGANRTGRPFTGDAAGLWVYGVLHQLGLSNGAQSLSRKDKLKLTDVYISNIVRCAPPKNLPLRSEIKNCNPFLKRELQLLSELCVIVALGRMAHETYLKTLGLKLSHYAFSHGALHRLPQGPILLDSYHPSRQNTQTGKLTREMWNRVLKKAQRLAFKEKKK